MVKMTRNGIIYDLESSIYETTILYDTTNDEHQIITYKFSSELYKNKFEDKIEKNREEIRESLYKRFGVDLDSDILADIRLYKSIEKRGFLIENKEESYKCLNTIKLSGLMMTNKN